MLTLVDPIEDRIRHRRQRLMSVPGLLDLNDPIWNDTTARDSASAIEEGLLDLI